MAAPKHWSELPEVVPDEYNSGAQVQYGNDKEQWNQYLNAYPDGVQQHLAAVEGHTPPPPFAQHASAKASEPWWKRKKFIWIGAIAVLIVVVIAVVVGVVVGKKGGGDGQPSSPSGKNSSSTTVSSSPTSSPTQSSDPTSSTVEHPFGKPTSLPSSLPPSSCQQAMCSNMLSSATLGSSLDRYIFARGAKGAMWYRRADGDRWATEWESLGGSFISPPTVVSINNNRLDVFGVWENEEPRVKTMLAGTTWDRDWLNLSGLCDSQLSSVSFGTDRLSLMCAANGRQAGLKYYRPHRWGPDHPGFEALGGWLTSAPALGSGANEYVSAVAYGFPNRTIGEAASSGAMGMMYMRFNSSHWLEWDGGWGQFKGDPALVAVTATQTEYFGIAVDGAMWHNSYEPEELSVRSTEMHGIVGDLDLAGLSLDYTVPENLGGNFTSTPFAWATGLQRLDVVAIVETGRLKHRARISGIWADEWEDLGGWFDSAPMVWPPTDQDEALHVFGLGPEGVVIHGMFSMGDGYELEEGSWFDDGGELTPTPYRVDN